MVCSVVRVRGSADSGVCHDLDELESVSPRHSVSYSSNTGVGTSLAVLFTIPMTRFSIFDIRIKPLAHYIWRYMEYKSYIAQSKDNTCQD